MPQPQTMPHSLDAERSVLGAMLLDEKAVKAAAVLAPDDFFSVINATIFAAMQRVNAKREPVDLVTLSQVLTADGHMDGVGGIAYLSDLSGYVPSTANVGSYIAIVKANAQRRAIYAAAQRIARIALDENAADDPRTAALSQLAQVPRLDQRSDDTSLPVIALHAYEAAERRAKGIDKGLPVGIERLDAMTGGLFAGELTVLAARPSVGKTAVALNMALHAALQGKHTVFFSREMTSEQLALRLYSRMAPINSQRLRVGNIDAQGWERMGTALQAMPPTMHVNDYSGTPGQMRAFAEEMRERSGLNLIVVDYLQITTPDMRTTVREQAVAQMSRAFKQMATELRVPVLLLAQLNRQGASRGDDEGDEGDPVPRLHHLRESGAIEQDADNVIFIHPTGGTRNDSAGLRYASLIVAKQRNGMTGSAKIVMNMAHMQIASLPAEPTAPNPADESRRWA